MDNVFKKLRMEKNPNEMEDYKIKDLSKDIGIAAPKISELETGKRNASLSELKAYHKHFNVPYEYLLGESNSRYYENMALSEELGLTGDAIEKLKQLYKKVKRFSRYHDDSSNRKDSWETQLRAINFLIETNHEILWEIGKYLDSALNDITFVQLQYVSISFSNDGNLASERLKTGHCDLEHQDYSEFCEVYLRNIQKYLRDWWKRLHDNYLKENPRKTPDTN